MQDRYAGDVGDFGKLGMLRCLEQSGFSIGINWYLVGNESHNSDGKHIGYLDDEKYCGCDDELLLLLRGMIEKETRSVLEIEKLQLLNTNKYYHERLQEPRIQNGMTRSEWHQFGLEVMSGCDLVFLDPDNGLLTKSVGAGSDKSIKYVLPEEILDYFNAGKSVIFYSHRTREQLVTYLERFADLFKDAEDRGAKIKGISFKRGTVRDYFFILHEEHVLRVENTIEKLLNSKWSQHFSAIQIPDRKVMSSTLLDFSVKIRENVTEMLDAARRVIQSEGVQTFFKGLFRLQDIIKLGSENNWVVILPGIDFGICKKTQEEIDEYFIKYIEQSDEIYQKIRGRITTSTLLMKKRSLLIQIFSAIDSEHYALAGIALSSTIEYILALDVGYDEYRIKKMIEDFKNNVEDISLDEDGLLPAFGLDGFLTNFSLDTKGFGEEKEPQFVNRHWVAHGRMHRDLTKVDVYQMLCAIYALDVVIETEQRVQDSQN